VKPRVAPLKRPSVSRATVALSSAFELMAAGHLQHLGIPGSPLGLQTITNTSPGLI